MTPASRPDMPELDELADFIDRHPRLFVLTGAGLSTASGIPDYRDNNGEWKNAQPIPYQAFVGSDQARRRYWARSMLGWPRFAGARPNPAHVALARLEAAGHVLQLVTQNVDRLHQRAGSRRVIDLHGRLDRVDCLDCRHRTPRHALQHWLEAANPGFRSVSAVTTPDGDARLEGVDFEQFRVPDCPRCNGVLKPAVVFFGENAAREQVALALEQLAAADALLVVGSSLMVYSGFRFCRAAAELGKPIAAVNLGRTRADDLLTLKLALPCDQALPQLVARLAA